MADVQVKDGGNTNQEIISIIDEFVDDVSVVKGTSKSGYEYVAIRIKFASGYESNQFLQGAERYLVESLLDKK